MLIERSGVMRVSLASDLPASRLETLKDFHQEVVGAVNHHVSELGFVANGISKAKSTLFHSRHQRIEVISLDSEMMNRSPSGRLRRLVINVYERASER